ncbi:MAG TPA: IS1595 family transposase [Candidatus Acidoferrales bacterium]|nr:IS1595 family transposase [Candidatus Acidoferrales bacterium]
MGGRGEEDFWGRDYANPETKEAFARVTIYLTQPICYDCGMAEREPETLVEAIRHFSDPDVCLDFMVSLRWPDGVKCPTCGDEKVTFMASRRVWQCKGKHPKRQFSVKVGTIFEDSPVGLDKWFATIWLISNAKNGVSSAEIARSIGVTQKTAWFMLDRIRLAMQTGTFEKLSGHVEVDETYIGGKARFMHPGKRKAKGTARGMVGKVAVMGLLERHGDFQYRIVENTKRRTLHGEISRAVAIGSHIYSDALASYRKLDDEYIHKVIDHAEAYVDGEVHTNGLENFWSLLKRSIKGTYVSIEPFHLFRYLDEQAFRFNNREMTDRQRFAKVAASVIGKRLTYRELTGKGSAVWRTPKGGRIKPWPRKSPASSSSSRV